VVGVSGGAPIVLALNCGSSSLKFGLYRVEGRAVAQLLDGEIEAIGDPEGSWSARTQAGPIASGPLALDRHALALPRIQHLLARNGLPPPTAIGHRIVHGGAKVRDHAVIDEGVLDDLRDAAAFDPLHAPAALEVIGWAREFFKGFPQVACLDTAFHRRMPDEARSFPLPVELRAAGIERYGFHGLSCESIVRQLGENLPDRLVIAHLGAGSSVTAVKKGRSIDTSMGLTPTGGMMMASRSGDLDPGLLIYLMRTRGLDADALETLVDRQSGLLGVSDLSGDPRRLRQAGGANTDARLALTMFAYAARKQVAAMASALEGLDLLVFTGGIGKYDAKTRKTIRTGLSWLRPKVRVLASREDEQIARHTSRLVWREVGAP
jgi:acetate kinase